MRYLQVEYLVHLVAGAKSRQLEGEIVFTTSESSAAWQRAVDRGEAQRVGRGIITTDARGEPSQIVRRNWALIAGHLVPGGTVVDRSFFDGGPARDGTVVLDVGPDGTRRTTPLRLPGLRIVTRVGPGPVAGDVPFMHGLHYSGQGRAFLDNLRPSRARSGVRRTITRGELEERLARMMTISGPEAVQRLRDEAHELASTLGAEHEAEVLDGIIGSLFGTRDALLRSRVAKAMRAGSPFDAQRVDLFAALQQALLAEPLPAPRTPRDSDDPRVFAFYESYFSNYIEGTRFTVEQAKDIVFNGVVPEQRPLDAHDIQGTFGLVYPPAGDARTPRSPGELVDLLKQRHRVLMTGRDEAAPGAFKTRNNRAGGTIFVDSTLIEGTFREGMRFYLGLPDGLPRAAFMMFFVAEVHPFVGGNGRIARVFMNAELSATGQQRIIVPTGFRQNYLTALTGMSRNDMPMD